MGILGKQELEYYKITPVGVDRIQSGRLRRLGFGPFQVLRDLVSLGGTAEIDELKIHSLSNPMFLRASLAQLVDLGLVVPVRMEGAQ